RVYNGPRVRHSFPTRRSSDLRSPPLTPRTSLARSAASAVPTSVAPLTGRRRSSPLKKERRSSLPDELETPARHPRAGDPLIIKRSEEHTSELQSRENLVCRLL